MNSNVRRAMTVVAVLVALAVAYGRSGVEGTYLPAPEGWFEKLTFNANGTLDVVLLGATEHMKYTVNGDTLTIVTPEGTREPVKVASDGCLEGDYLWGKYCKDAKGAQGAVPDDARAFHNQGLIFRRDGKRAEAATAFRKACEIGLAQSCRVFNALYRTDPTRDTALYEKACDGNDLGGCFNLGLLYQVGVGVTKDDIRAMTLYKKACDGSYFGGCFNLGLMYQGTGTASDLNAAVILYQKGCNGNDFDACNELGLLYQNGFRVPQDAARAVALYQKACNGNDFEGCFNLGVMYQRGAGVAQDAARAGQLYRRACDGALTKACSRTPAP